ncbi:MAG TPA: hypothetical protein VEH79_02930, partial [Gaiellaceae bacterium]|nr:hypothetical protein [Gaiellaceae bacterium]
AGFKVKVLSTTTTDPTQDDKVVTENPAGNTPAKPGSLVTITVAHLTTPPTSTTTTTTATTTTTTTTTTTPTSP